jgi:hypothetical protein
VASELILLALATAVRPTSLAAIYALLTAGSPRRLLTAYVIAGAAFTITIGLLVIWAFNGINISSGTSQTKSIADIGGGLIALTFGVLVLTRRIGGGHPDDAPKAPSRWSGLVDRHLTLRTAALAGPATHIPGVFYLIALNLIVTHQTRAAARLADLLLYNAVWFALPVAGLAICIFKPAAAVAAVGATQTWTRTHARAIVLTVSFAVGAWLLIHGLLTI